MRVVSVWDWVIIFAASFRGTFLIFSLKLWYRRSQFCWNFQHNHHHSYIHVAIRNPDSEGHTCKGVCLYKLRSSSQCIGIGIGINIIETFLIYGVIFYSGAADNGTLMRRDGGNNCFCSLHTGEKSARAIGKDLFNIWEQRSKMEITKSFVCFFWQSNVSVHSWLMLYFFQKVMH